MGVPEDDLDWQSLMKLGMGFLRINPDVFWQMTFPEFMASIEPLKSSMGKKNFLPPLSRADLEKIMKRFPDL